MNAKVTELLPEFALGTLAPAEMERVAQAVDGSVAMRATVDAIVESLAQNAAALAPVQPTTDVRARLMRSLGSVERFQPFFVAMSQALDMAIEAVRALCARIDRSGDWEAGPSGGIHLIHFRPGPALVAAVDAGLVRMAPGTTFPRHRHLGHEWNMVLEGTLHDGDRVYRAGEVFCYENQSAHEYSAGPERDLLMIAMHHGIEDASAS